MAKRTDFDNLPSNNKIAPNKRPVKANLRGKTYVASNRGGLASEVRDIFNNQFANMVKPSIMRLVYDFCEGAIRMLILGESGGPRLSGTLRRTSYNQQYRQGPTYQRLTPTDYQQPQQRQPRVIRETPYSPIIFTSRKDAEDIWRIMMDFIEEYGSITVGRLYALCDEPHNMSHHRWGWTDVSMAGIGTVEGGGFYIDLPEPVHQ